MLCNLISADKNFLDAEMMLSQWLEWKQICVLKTEDITWQTNKGGERGGGGTQGGLVRDRYHRGTWRNSMLLSEPSPLPRLSPHVLSAAFFTCWQIIPHRRHDLETTQHSHRCCRSHGHVIMSSGCGILVVWPLRSGPWPFTPAQYSPLHHIWYYLTESSLILRQYKNYLYYSKTTEERHLNWKTIKL